MQPPYALTLFGAIELRGDDAAADRLLVNNKATALLAYLALPRPDRFVRRDMLAALLWPELDQERARTALRKTAFAIRQVLSERALVSRGDEELALSSEIVWCDAARFNLAADEAFLLEALQLYRGELMPGFQLPDCWEFGEWLEQQRSAAREQAAAAAWALAQRLEHEDALTDAAKMARLSVRYSWSDERALRRALVMLDRLGDVAGALRLYDTFARRLAQEMDAEPSG